MLKRIRLFYLALSVLQLAALQLPAARVFAQSDPAGNLAGEGVAVASSYGPEHLPGRVNDGSIDSDSYWKAKKNWGQWETAEGRRGQWIEIRWPFVRSIGSIQLYAGLAGQSAPRHLQIEYFGASGEWRLVPGTNVEHNADTALRFVLDQPVISSRLRVVILEERDVSIHEILVYPPVIFGEAPPLAFDNTGRRLPDTTRFISPPDPGRHHVLVNQTGYTSGRPMRFTAPVSSDGSRFELLKEGDERPVYTGTIRGGVGDFSEAAPVDPESDYTIRVTGAGKAAGISYPFRIAPMFFQQMALEPALRFMVDARSYTGTHPSAYGGNPWRDGTYYTYELPSLVLLYMANPAWFEQAAVEIDYQADRERILDPAFWYTNEPSDSGAIEGARRYYRELDPPVGPRVPDLVQMLHWGIGYHLMHPNTRDNSERVNGKQTPYVLHGQTLEQFAFFLYAFPAYSKYFTARFYERARDFAFDNWEKTGLLKVQTEIGGFKGRHCPGHSIAPNLMMYEVAKREGRADAGRYLDAAIAQAEWLVSEVDPADPAATKGQRMSEHKLSTGLFFLKRLHPGLEIKGLDDWVRKWTDIMLGRSRNMYDFRRYSADSWTIPAENVKWNDPGSVAGFPGTVAAMSFAGGQPEAQTELRILEASHIDHLFGRNPLKACATQHIEDFKGAEIRWPKFDRWDVCARIELTRGAICSVPGDEQYPFDPTEFYRHPEGWTTFNSALNVSLAYLCWEDTELSASTADGVLRVRLRAPVNHEDLRLEKVPVTLEGPAGEQTLELTETGLNSLEFEGSLDLPSAAGPAGAKLRIRYGFGPFSRETEVSSEK